MRSNDVDGFSRLAWSARPLLLAVLAVGISLPRPSLATPILRIAWGGCDEKLQETWSGPGTYRIVFSATGIDSVAVGYWFVLDASGVDPVYLCPPGEISDAWRFDAVGCHPFPSVQSIATEASPECPALATQGPLLATFVSYDPDYQTMRFEMLASFLPHDPDPAQRYTLGQFVFDMSAATAGPTVPSVSCGGAEEPACFSLTRSELTYEDGNPGGSPLLPEWEGVGWQGVIGPCFCPQVESSTWGRVKALYR